jgi:hypothetical protein
MSDGRFQGARPHRQIDLIPTNNNVFWKKRWDHHGAIGDDEALLMHFDGPTDGRSSIDCVRGCRHPPHSLLDILALRISRGMFVTLKSETNTPEDAFAGWRQRAAEPVFARARKTVFRRPVLHLAQGRKIVRGITIELNGIGLLPRWRVYLYNH